MRRVLVLCVLGLVCACSESTHVDQPAPSRADASKLPDAGSKEPAEAGGAAGDARIQNDPMDAAGPIDADWHGEVPQVCDGTQRIRLWYHTIDNASRAAPGEFLLYQNGGGWLITGNCHYYAQAVQFSFPLKMSEGDLEPSEAQEIGRRVHFGQSLTSSVSSAPTFDASLLRLELADESVICVGACDTAPPETRDAMASAMALSNELAKKGKRWRGAMRISVIERPLALPRTWDRFAIDWPLQIPVADVSIRDEDTHTTSYNGVLIESSDDLQALRALPNTETGYNFWPVRGDLTSYYELRARDAIPLEDTDGNIQRTWETGDE